MKKQSSRQRSLELFSQLQIWNTEHRNGLLIYLLIADRAVEIVADRGINGKVDAHEWDSICCTMEYPHSGRDTIKMEFVLSPEVAALSMSGSTLLVAINALMLKRTKLDGIRQANKTALLAQPSAATPAKVKETALTATTTQRRNHSAGYIFRPFGAARDNWICIEPQAASLARTPVP